MTPEPHTDSGLRDFLTVVRRRKWSILLITLVALGATMYLTSKQVPVYQSRAEVLVRPIGPNSVYAFFPGIINLETEAGIAESYPVAQIAAKSLDSNLSPEQLLGNLNVTPGVDSDILTLAYMSTDPKVAQANAQAFADAYLKYRRERALEQAADQNKDAQRQLADIDRRVNILQQRLRRTKDPAQQQSLIAMQSNLSARQGILQQQMQQITGQSTITGGGGEVVQPAALPRGPISPAPRRNALLALLLGCSLGIGLAFARERLDNRLRGRRDFESLIGAPVLATIPQVRGWRKTNSPELVTRSDPRGAPSEAYRALRTNIQYLWREQDIRTIAITSAKMGDGKTTTVANLAVSLAQAGRKVIAVSCDLRKPRLHAFFGLGSDAGVTSLLTGEADLLDVVQRTDIENLRLVASGPVPPNPAELLSTDAMEHLITDLREMGDIVLLDTPPILAVADSLIIGPKTDGVLIVADASSGVRDEVAHVREELEQVGGRIIGGVFNAFDPERALYYSPQYRKRYGYGYAAYYGTPGTEAQASVEKAGRFARRGKNRSEPVAPPEERTPAEP